MDLKLIKKLEYFHLYSSLGFTFSGVDKYEKYNIFYHNQSKMFTSILLQTSMLILKKILTKLCKKQVQK